MWHADLRDAPVFVVPVVAVTGARALATPIKRHHRCFVERRGKECAGLVRQMMVHVAPLPVPVILRALEAGAQVQRRAIHKLADAGFGERILLSHDVCLESHFEATGGNGYSFILRSFVGRLEASGLPRTTVESFITTNPARALCGG